MNTKIVSLFLVLGIYQVAALSYEEAFKGCKTKYGLTSDEALDYFMDKGEFQAGKENLKCFFECLASDLAVKKSDGSIDGEALKKLALEHTHCQELALFGSESVVQACALPYENFSTSCDKVYQFIHCAIKAKNSANKA